MIKILASILALSFVTLASSTCDFSSSICSSSGISCSQNTLMIENVAYPAYEYDVISFGDFTLNHGDVQGRIAVRDNFYGTNGISVGLVLNDTLPFSLVVGGDLFWTTTGSINEGIFVGGEASLSSDLTQQLTARCNTSGCLNSDFDSLANFWTQISSYAASQASNVETSIADGIATLSCSDSPSFYVVNWDSTDFNNVIGYSAESCSSSATWVFNIIGSGDVFFGGNPIDVAGSVIFNIVGSRGVTVSANVNGNILAPSSTLAMIGGTITGQLIAGNVTNCIQVNRADCPATSSSTSSGAASTSSSTLSTSSSTGSTGDVSSGSASSLTEPGNAGGVTNDEGSSASSVVASLVVSGMIMTLMM